MPRTAKLGKKNGHWYSEAGGKGRYFGRVDSTPYSTALKLFRESLAGASTVVEPPVSTLDTPVGPTAQASAPEPYRIRALITVAELKTAFLAWLKRHRGERTHGERSRHLERFASRYGQCDASRLTGDDLEAFLNTLAESGAARDYQHKHEVSIRAMIRWGVKQKKLPDGFTPFAAVEPIRPPAKALLESDLPTLAEVRAVIESATPTLADLLRVQYATGARTGELASASVRDYQRATRQIVLAEHKRAKTMREPAPRVIVLNADANTIVARLCEGRSPNTPLFPTPTGRRWNRKLLSTQFGRARTKAKGRDGFTPYSLRHLWISEALMAGLDIALVARMVGTSVAMVERVYGRFRSQSLADAQARLDSARAARGL